MKKVLILYAKYGGGHFSAAKSIQTYFEENYFDVEVKLIDCVEYFNSFFNKITTGAYKQMAKKAPWAWKKIYYNSQKGLLAKLSTSANKLMAKKLHTLFKEFLPDIVISTHFFATQITSYLKEHENVNCILATILTDFAPHNQWLIGKNYNDLFFVANENMKQELINSNIPENKIFVTGIPLSERFSDTFKVDEIYKEHNLKHNKKVILFFGGGEFGLGKNRTVKILKSLTQHLNTYQIIAISGKNKNMNSEFLKLHKELEKANSPYISDLHIYKYTTNVPELMNISSLVVTKPGGLTSSESLVSNLPMLIINPIPGQEEENATFLENAGVAVWLKKDDDIDITINNLLSDENKMKKMSMRCKNFAKPYSSRDIVEIILTCNPQGRRTWVIITQVLRPHGLQVSIIHVFPLKPYLK